jgi:hypothetical protein
MTHPMKTVFQNDLIPFNAVWTILVKVTMDHSRPISDGPKSEIVRLPTHNSSR